MMINSIRIITTTITAPAIIPMAEGLLLVSEELLGDGVNCSVTTAQSAELNDSSIVGQLGSMSKITEAMVS